MSDALDYLLVEDHREDSHRSGEGAMVELNDGRILMLYTAFRGESSADHAPANILSRFSADGGQSWSDSRVVFRPPLGALNVMSPSLLRLNNGRIACTFSVKWSETHCAPHWTISDDEGTNWVIPRSITSEAEYFVVNNDRLIQLREGSLLLPYALLRGITRGANDKELLKEWLNGWCGVFASEDGGETWHRPDNARKFNREWFVLPNPLYLEDMPKVEQRAIQEKYDVFQEPGVVELADGRLLMWMRSLSHIFQAFSTGVNSPWTDFSAMDGFNVSCSPQTIKRVPLNGNLVMLYNDRGDVPFGSPIFQFRTPLSVAISSDEGRTWKKLEPLEPDQSRNYCYFGLLFVGEKFFVSYYESVTKRNADGTIKTLPDGTPERRNLASLKLCCGNQRRLNSELAARRNPRIV